jgi:hypothetical protein
MDVKTFAGGIDVKGDGSKGKVEAVISEFNLKDGDADVTLPMAFTEGERVVLSDWGHSIWGTNDPATQPVGHGVLRTTPKKCIVSAQFNMKTTAGRDCFESVKSLAEQGLGMWSFGYETLDSEPGTFKSERVQFLKRLKVYEASPCLRGSGPTTRTLSAKSQYVCGHKTALPADLDAKLRTIRGELFRQSYLERQRLKMAHARMIREQIREAEVERTRELLRDFARRWL